jgi:predicted O-methyltransferase YrrM
MKRIARKLRIVATQKRTTASLVDEIKTSFNDLNLLLEDELERWNDWAQFKGGKYHDMRSDSIHPLLLSGLMSMSRAGKVLEFGTYLGETSAFLADTHKEWNIHTIDLPSTDPLLRGMYGRDKDAQYETFRSTQLSNVRKNNIDFKEFNTLFFGSTDLANQTFDIVWLDAGHNYPEVAWDFSHALSVLKKGGFLVVDDVIPITSKYKNEYVSTDSWELIQYLEKRQSVKITKVLKRADNERFRDPQKRKYVVIIEL